MLGRIFGLVATAPFAGSTLAYAAGGILLDLTSPRTVFLIGGVGVLVVLVPRPFRAPSRAGPPSFQRAARTSARLRSCGILSCVVDERTWE
jgi:MFS family permease